MAGFAHDIAGGNGTLVVPAVKSPNFVHGSTGWSINKDGSAEFHDIIIPAGSGGTVVTFASTAPASPNVGDVWYDTSSGLKAHVWNGTAFVAFFLGGSAIGASSITGGNIAAATITATNIVTGTITAAKLAAGIIVAGIVDGTTITGATLVADGTSGNVLAYSGTPAAGNLIASVSPVSGTDGFGNAYSAGLWSYIASPGSGSAGLNGANLDMNDGHGLWGVGPDYYTTGAADYFLVTNNGTSNSLWIDVNGILHANEPAVIAPETWHKPSSLSNGWAQGSPAFQYRLLPSGGVQLCGIINSAAMTNVAFFTLPSAYFPAVGLDFPVAFHSSGVASNVFGRVSTAGVLSVINSTTSTGLVVLDTVIPLDLT